MLRVKTRQKGLPRGTQTYRKVFQGVEEGLDKLSDIHDVFEVGTYRFSNFLRRIVLIALNFFLNIGCT